MYDAVSVKSTSSSSGEEERGSVKHGRSKKPATNEEMPDEIALFLPMLEEYLRSQ